MKNWSDIKWIFKKDGELRDIYIQNTTISDWEKVVELLNSDYKLTFGVYKKKTTNKIDFEFVNTMFGEETGQMETKSATIDLNGIVVKCYFFLKNQIEFDINPSDIKTENEFNTIIDFMKSISSKLEKEITLCGENQSEFPLIKIDTKKGSEKVLALVETKKLWKKSRQNTSGFTTLKSKTIMNIFSKLFERKILESEYREYNSTLKENTCGNAT